ncbi:hypothetical protein KIW84_050085 [Lathyrus oleraceus]|uniref:Uncharacterized protein n=1 Tax=Pisum sativum TaxID=3888 RepID=A0A9D5AC03_PEA|nr:hypothetical protein KIW84_050085 [Pisum sativum]
MSIVDVTKVTRSGRVFEPMFPKDMEDSIVSKKVEVPAVDPVSAPKRYFYDEELSEKVRNHNLALHISMNYKEDDLSNMLVDTGSSLNVLPQSTLSKLSYQGALMRYSGVIVKAFDGSLYSCLLGRPWIHEAGAITSTFHQKLKFAKNGKLVIVGVEKVMLVSHLSSFSYGEADDEVGTPF